MRKICITIILLSILMVAVALPCGADLEEEIDVTLEWYGPLEDINHDGDVDYLDASILVSHFDWEGNPGGIGENRWDINSDWIVDYLDASRLVNKYGLHWIDP